MENNLKALRKEHRLTLQQLGDLTGIVKSYVHDLQKSNNNPSLEIAYKISNVLGVTVYDIWPDTTKTVEETITVRRLVKT